MRQYNSNEEKNINKREIIVNQEIFKKYESYLKIKHTELHISHKFEFYSWAHFILHETILLSPFYKFHSDEFKEVLILTIRSFATSLITTTQKK
ncbi:hypothetical protein [Spartinivicinus ruber]|uniref:hypothetical protein n=1 Tax=Spartinivicinus ruber TaxID=2683272 RepID=UPI0013D09862|nr:hypothetical protein [Spartinivicinus ruber]